MKRSLIKGGRKEKARIKLAAVKHYLHSVILDTLVKFHQENPLTRNLIYFCKK